MARPSDSRSPAPAGSPDASRHHRQDAGRRDRERQLGNGRDHRLRNRSRSPDVSRSDQYVPSRFPDVGVSQRNYRQRDGRLNDNDRDRDLMQRRDQSPYERDDAYYRSDSREFRDHQRSRQRGPDGLRDRDRDREPERDRDRARGPDKTRPHSRDRPSGRIRSPDHRRRRSRDSDRSYRSRDASRERVQAKRDGGPDSPARSQHRRTLPNEGGRLAAKDVRPPLSPSLQLLNSSLISSQTKAANVRTDAEKKAERLAKLKAWKKKKESETLKQRAQTPNQVNEAKKLPAEMDKKDQMTGSASPGAAPQISLASPQPSTEELDSRHLSAAESYAGKFDPKTIARKSAAARSHEPTRTLLGSLDAQTGKAAAAQDQDLFRKEAVVKPTGTNCRDPTSSSHADVGPAASALPANRGKTSGFGFGKATIEIDRLPNKRKLDLDGEDTIQRKLIKLPTLFSEADETPYDDQDDDYDSGDNVAVDEEDAVAADRAAHERRVQADKQADGETNGDTEQHPSQDSVGETNGEPAASQTVDETKLAAEDPTKSADRMDADGVKEDPGTDVKHEGNGGKLDEDAGRVGVKMEKEITVLAEQESKEDKVKIEKTTEEEKEEVEEDPLDAFMAELNQTNAADTDRSARASTKTQEPETYFGDEERIFEKGTADEEENILAMAKKRKKKDIPTIDYSKIEIQPIRKDFWVEPAELAALTEAEVSDLRLELDGIKVKGKNVPKPVQKWAQCGLTRQTLDVISNLGYERPTAIQTQAIPALMSGRDVVGVAKTGSGKTIAFLLPMFRHILDQPPSKETDGPIGLIMTPTRELTTQIHRDCKPFLKGTNLRAVCAYGGAPVRDQIAELKRGAAIIVCTPGRMIDLLAANQGRVTNLKRVTYVVLDEADRMFDMGFEPQVMKIFANIRPDKQTILFSATMPRLIDSLTKKVLRNPVEITVGGRSVVAKEIEQIVEVREEDSKFIRVLELLGGLYDRDEDARSLIFVERQEKADELLKELMVKGYPCMSIHGGKDQIDRGSTISDFKKGIVPILIATSIAARGLDVKQLKLVINYDAPNHMEDYVHRAGRTGRAGNIGVAVTFVTPEQDNCAPGIAKALEQSGQAVPEKLDQMRQAYREKVKAGKAKESSGFGGKGLDRLDQEREAARQVQRRTHRAEGEEEEEKEEKRADDQNEKALDAIKAAASGVKARDTPKVEDAEAKAPAPVQKTAEVPSGATDKAHNPLDRVSSAVSAINIRLGKSGQLRSGQPIDNKGPDAGAFHATLEINDFPQKARWAVTNRTNVAKILDSTGTSITTKGSFYPPGKEVPPNADPKLYILIEGDTEVSVSSALQEMTRLLREATIAAADADSRAPASGRYTVT